MEAIPRDTPVAGHYEEQHKFPATRLFEDDGFYGLVAAVNHVCASFQALRCPRGSQCDQPRFDSRDSLVLHASGAEHCEPLGLFRRDDGEGAEHVGDWDWRHERFLLPMLSEDSSADFHALLSSLDPIDSDDEGKPEIDNDASRPRFMQLANGEKVDISTLM